MIKHRDFPIVILIAEDDEDDRLLIKEAFVESELPVSLYFVGDGEVLMDYLHHRGGYCEVSQSPRPDMILLDLNMPKKDGRQALAEIKSDPELRHIPIVILTTSKESKDILRSYDLGANSFITKPVTFGGLVELMKSFGHYWFEMVELPLQMREPEMGKHRL